MKKIQLLFVLLVCITITACSGSRREIRDIPPLVQLVQLEVVDQNARLSLRIRNPNDLPLTGRKLTFQLFLDEQLAAIYSGTPKIDVIANSAEEIRLDVKIISLNVLDSMQQMTSRTDSIRWELTGKLQLDQRIRPDIANSGRLSPIPGQANTFR